MFRRAMSPNHNAPNTAFVPGDRLLSGGLRRGAFRILPAWPCIHAAQTQCLLFKSIPAANTPWGGQYWLQFNQSESRTGTYRTTDALVSAGRTIEYCGRRKREIQANYCDTVEKEMSWPRLCRP